MNRRAAVSTGGEAIVAAIGNTEKAAGSNARPGSVASGVAGRTTMLAMSGSAPTSDELPEGGVQAPEGPSAEEMEQIGKAVVAAADRAAVAR